MRRGNQLHRVQHPRAPAAANPHLRRNNKVEKGATCCTNFKKQLAIIRSSKGNQPVFWQALRVICEKELYWPQFHSFEDFCRAVPKIKKRMALYYVAAARVVENCGIHHTISFATVRPLLGLTREHQRLAWLDAVSMTRDGCPSAAQVKIAAKKFTAKPLDKEWSQRAAAALFNRRVKTTIELCLFGSTPEQRDKFLALLPELLEHCLEFCRTCETLLVQTIPDGNLNYDEAKQIVLRTVRLSEVFSPA